MLKKIFKTIFIISLCVGLTLPTNAAVSVSDGSAFVTKAEFAADLNNLSNRMAQLENSLDAKIDSLVSSYLTRNGIWNGALQYSGNSYTFFTYGQVTNDNWCRLLAGKGNCIDSGWRLIGDFNESLSKTGLLMCKLESFMNPDYTGVKEWWTFSTAADGGGWTIGATGLECILATGDANNRRTVYRTVLYEVPNFIAANGNQAYRGYKVSSWINIASFMVNKGEYLYGKVQSFGGQRATGDNNGLNGASTEAMRNNFGLKVYDMYIY